MIRLDKLADERRESGPTECWLLHGAVGAVSDWRSFASRLGERRIGSRAVDLWRFLDCCPMSLDTFGKALDAEASGSSRPSKVLVGYSMGGRMALHALLEDQHPWQAAVIISAHPGLEDEMERCARRERDAAWASRALTAPWSEFLAEWQSQPVLAGTEIRDNASSSRLAQRRREIARSFVDWSLGAQQPLWSRLSEIRIPVLWVAGEWDETYTLIAQRATSLIPTARLAIAPSCGHRVPWLAEDWLVEQIAGFLA